ncbi:MAG TPA: pitrilysin family protein [Kofleriaceae bacterium]|nr:pitrilysin family protein [Kofleriaceae bacterium]
MTRTSATFAILAAAGALAAFGAGCGSTPVRDIIPTLPADGDAHTAKPPAEAAPVAAADPWDRKDLIQPPATPPPEAIKLPPIDRFTLPNGLQVITVTNPKLPVVTVQLEIRAGRAEEPLVRMGVAELTGDVLLKGTKKRDALAIARTIDKVGATLSADASYEATWVSCTALARDVGTCLEVLPDVVINPSFPAPEVDRARDNLLAGVARRLDDPNLLAGAHIQNLIWGNDHVRGWVTSSAWLQGLTRSDVVAWHKTWFVPANSILVVSGAIDAARLRKDLARAFAPWKSAPVPARPQYPDPQPRGPRVRLVDKPGQDQTFIRVGQLGIRHDDARFFPTLVWNYALGGGLFDSRLMQELRVKGGKTYGASSTFDRNIERGSFVIATSTRAEETVATLEMVIDQMDKMQADGPTQQEVDAAIANLAGGYGIRLSGLDDVGAALATAEMHGLNQTYVSDFPVLVARVTREDAADAAHDILTPDQVAVVLVGDASKIGPQLDAAKVPYDKVSYTDPIGPQPEAASVAPEVAAAGTKILDAALAAKGGDKVKHLTSLVMEASGKLSSGGQVVDVDFKRTMVLPDKMRMDITLANQFKIAFAAAGNRQWSAGPNGVEDLPPEQLPELERQRWVDPELVLTRYLEPGARVEALPGKTIDGAAVDVVRVTSADHKFTATLSIDHKTQLLVEDRYPGPNGETVDHFSDYKVIDGVQIAQHRVSVGGGETSDLTITKVELNGSVPDSVFDRPADTAPPSGPPPSGTP